jgi:hypothetical protein
MATNTDKGVKDGHKSIRLVQEAYNLVSFSLYAKLGFEPKEQLNFFMGRCVRDWPDPKLQLTIRPMTANDLASCASLHKYVLAMLCHMMTCAARANTKLYRRVVGVERELELAECLSSTWSTYHDEPLVAEEEGSGRIVGYVTSVTLPGHSVGESDEVVARLHFEMTRRVSASRNDDSVLFKVIGRLSPGLVKWALTGGGLRLQRNATLMALGSYADPVDGVYVPSIGY